MEIFGKKIDGVLIIIGILVLAGLSWWFVSSSTNMMSKGQNIVSTQQGVLDNAVYEIYNSRVVKGEVVVDCINRSESMFPNKVTVKVTTGGSASKSYGWAGATYTAYGVTDPNSNDYINPSKSFSSAISKNDNGVVDEIIFIQQ